ncbi:MAG: peptidylprolyl isomerase [Caulobacteraceae bacterium]|nr:peptidylprolyl isomerase [Caulobacteraceae bacterium]
MKAAIASALVLAALGTGASAATPAAPPPVAPPSAADWRTPDPENLLVIDTSKGRVLLELDPRAAPLAAARVRELARAKFYDGRAFFRVIDGFMDQTGDPTDTGTGGSNKPDLAPEFTFRRDAATPFTVLYRDAGREVGLMSAMPVVSQPTDLGLLTADHKVAAYVSFCPGVAGMARAEDPGSANSQFFLMRGATVSLDGQYTAFGRVIAGMDAVRAIKTGEPVPAPQDAMTTVRVLADLPAAARPRVRVIRADSPWLAAEAARVKAEKVVGAPICDVDLPSQVE